ncbi:MAG: DUF4394 domain-containing protein [Fimbriimonadaceae bacterium]|nr:DUF4394 domain-containing protein [Fimbriimonadaceae bacterium]QYK55995.1 MAG: DUF4394 domain-containing protein [Fimbriimonadaceae bacterium]
MTRAIHFSSTVALAAIAIAANAQQAYALTSDNRLVGFDVMNPVNLTSNVNFSGFAQQNELILAIDYRPATGQLYALGSSSRLYTVNENTGVLTAVGSGPFSPTLNGVEHGFDFNPTVDRVRIVSDLEQNLRGNPNDGTVLLDGNLAFASGDVNFGANPNIVASAYTNNFAGAQSTTLYNIDSNLDVLVIQNPANSGALVTVGSLGMDITNLAGFDIVGVNTAWAVMQRAGDARSWLTSINLTTGQATAMSVVGGNSQNLRGLAVVPEPASMIALGAGLAALVARRRKS